MVGGQSAPARLCCSARTAAAGRARGRPRDPRPRASRVRSSGRTVPPTGGRAPPARARNGAPLAGRRGHGRRGEARLRRDAPCMGSRVRRRRSRLRRDRRIRHQRSAGPGQRRVRQALAGAAGARDSSILGDRGARRRRRGRNELRRRRLSGGRGRRGERLQGRGPGPRDDDQARLAALRSSASRASRSEPPSSSGLVRTSARRGAAFVSSTDIVRSRISHGGGPAGGACSLFPRREEIQSPPIEQGPA
jgi:hypothetical protein